jgi:hypothetical protein
LLLAFVVGGYAGMLLMALLVVARDSDHDDEGRGRRDRSSERVKTAPASGDDWVI